MASHVAYFTFGHRLVEGWIAPQVFWICNALSQEQQRTGVKGAVAEIGIHHGRFFLGLDMLRARGEKSLAIDLFEDQSLNIDKSGKGSMSALVRNLDRFKADRGAIEIMAADSTTLSPEAVTSRVGLVRLFSVDGGHTAEIVASDMALASSSLVSGGVVVGDDVYNAQWPGVIEGTLRFLDEHDDLVAFAIGFNKVFFARPEHADGYREVCKKICRTFAWEHKESILHGATVEVMWRAPLRRKHRVIAKSLLRRD